MCVVELFLGVVRALQRWIQKCPFLNRLFAEALPEVLLDSRGAPKNKTFLESLVYCAPPNSFVLRIHWMP